MLGFLWIFIYSKVYSKRTKEMPACPMCRTTFAASVGLRLYQENKCAICLEKCSEMIALPCGHQFCKEDIEKVGFRQSVHGGQAPNIQTVHNLQAQFVQSTTGIVIDLTGANNGLPIVNNGLPIVRRRRRCGWCGHIGHTQRRCLQHIRQCGCKTYRGSRHKQRLRAKHPCALCHKRGHSSYSCTRIVRGVRTPRVTREMTSSD